MLRAPSSRLPLIIVGVGVAVAFFFYAGIDVFQLPKPHTTLGWWWKACNAKTDYEHGRFVPAAIILLLFIHRKRLMAAPVKPSNVLGPALLIFGCLLFLISIRAVQGRIGIGAIPFIVLGGTMFLWGKEVTKVFLFPMLLVFFAIPLPGLNQATNALQIVATEIAFHVSTLLGADVVQAGNNINSTNSEWGFDIAGGCSGIRSLVALTLIAAIYAHLTQKQLWKKLVIFASAVPLALIANGLRVTTIVLIAEYGSAEFAGATYHNFSGFLFFPLGLAGIILVDLALNRKLPWSRSTKGVTRRVTRGKPDAETDTPSA